MFMLALAIMMAGCGFRSTPSPAPTIAPLATTAPTPTPLPTFTPTLTPTPHPLTPSEIFERVSPSIGFVDASSGSGSGFLIQNRYLVTNAHVVWPADSARIVFPDGSEFPDTPVVKWDLIADLAVLGPLDVNAPSVEPSYDEEYAVGSNVYLIGYPGEVEEFPQPSISRGIISRLREWPREKLTYYQTDAAIAGGLSGGVLVSDEGKVIGIAGYQFDTYKFGLAVSMADVMPRLNDMIAGRVVDGLDRKPLAREFRGEHEALIEIRSPLEAKTFAFWPQEQMRVKFELEGDEDLLFFIRDARGGFPNVAETLSDIATRKANFLANDAPYFTVVFNRFGQEAEGTLRSTVPLLAVEDSDDALQPLSPDSALRGASDFPGDQDVFPIDLREGQTIYILVESIMIDPMIRIEQSSFPKGETLAKDQNSGGGLLGLDAELSFRAPGDDRYLIVVHDAGLENVGGYHLIVEDFAEPMPTPIAPTPTPTPIPTKFGPMALYIRTFAPRITLFYPADWWTNRQDCMFFQADCFGDSKNKLVIMVEEKKTPKNFSLEKYAGQVAQSIKGVEIIDETRFMNPQGFDFVIKHLRSDDKALHFWMAATLHQRTPIVLLFMMSDVETLAEKSDEASPDPESNAFSGGLEAFEAMVRYIIDNFDVQ
ncbi:MAG: trypsin-like peptidase domain-containing protein [Chloroflexi bacterium]|nr:trypsin-like peptidase domain-containing protein [Chloroflexota bacterium]